MDPNAIDTSGKGDDDAAAALVAKAAAEAGKTVDSPGDAAAKAAADKAAADAAAAKAAKDKADADAAADAARKAAEAGEQVRYEYSPTGDVGLDVALSFIGNLGFPAEHAAVQAATKGDFGPMEAAMKALGDRAAGYEKYLALAKTAYDTRTAAAKAKVDADEKAVYAAVGGKEVWDQVAAYTKANADEAEKVQIEAAMKAGGLQAQSMAVLLLKAYRQAHPQTPGLVKSGASGASSPAGNTLSAVQYAEEVRKLRGKIRGPIDNHPDYLALRQKFAQSQK